MTTEVTTLNQTELALVKSTVAKGATDEELRLFLYDCQRRGVHPLDKLLHFTVRTSKDGTRRYTPITSIDFMRMQAADEGCAGIDDAIFQGDVKSPEFAATVTVYKVVGGIRCPFTGTARWPEYYAGTSMWDKMPHTMLGKCAEALALRKAFPRKLGGLYTREEMDQAGLDEAEPRTIKPPQAKPVPQPLVGSAGTLPPPATVTLSSDQFPDGRDIEATMTAEDVPFDVHPGKDAFITEKQRKRLFALWKQAGWGDDEFKAALKEVFGVNSTTEIPKKDYEAVCGMAENGRSSSRS